MGDGEFILFQPYSLFEALYESPFFWMGGDDTYANTASAHRGRFTEDVAYARLQRVFGPHVYQNVHLERQKGEETGEIDVLILFGDRAIVLQAKSKRLTLEARKGNDLQIKDDFKKAIQDSYDQALVCANALLDGGQTLKTAGGQEIALAMPLKQIFPICIVSDHYPALAFQTRQFLKSESTETISPPLVFDVFTLDTITEMLETPLQLLSYLDLRRRYGEKTLAMHELTLLSTHLKYNLWVGQDYDFVSLGDDIGVHLA
jgi:Nuclease-related domain